MGNPGPELAARLRTCSGADQTPLWGKRPAKNIPPGRKMPRANSLFPRLRQMAERPCLVPNPAACLGEPPESNAPSSSGLLPEDTPLAERIRPAHASKSSSGRITSLERDACFGPTVDRGGWKSSLHDPAGSPGREDNLASALRRAQPTRTSALSARSSRERRNCGRRSRRLPRAGRAAADAAHAVRRRDPPLQSSAAGRPLARRGRRHGHADRPRSRKTRRSRSTPRSFAVPGPDASTCSPRRISERSSAGRSLIRTVAWQTSIPAVSDDTWRRSRVAQAAMPGSPWTGPRVGGPGGRTECRWRARGSPGCTIEESLGQGLGLECDKGGDRPLQPDLGTDQVAPQQRREPPVFYWLARPSPGSGSGLHRPPALHPRLRKISAWRIRRRWSRPPPPPRWCS